MNRRKSWMFYGLIVAAVIVACSTTPRKVFQGQGLSTGEPGMNAFIESEPGETNKLERPYESAPPLVPHSVSGFEISRDTNDCLDCHMEGIELDVGHTATKIPKSHFKNEYTGRQMSDTVAANRYTCTQCHVPQNQITDSADSR